MSLVLTRKLNEGIRVQVPDGYVDLVLVKLEGNQVRIGINGDKKYEIQRLDREGVVQEYNKKPKTDCECGSNWDDNGVCR